MRRENTPNLICKDSIFFSNGKKKKTNNAILMIHSHSNGYTINAPIPNACSSPITLHRFSM